MDSDEERLNRILADGSLRLDEGCRYGFYVLDGPGGMSTIIDARNPDLLLEHGIRVAPSAIRYRETLIRW